MINSKRTFYICLVTVLISSLILLSSCPAFANDPFRKLGRGLTNVAFGWFEIFKEIGIQVQDHGDFAGILVGPVKGTAKFVGRTLVGVYDVITFYLPVPEDYAPVIEPEFIF